MVDLSHRLVMPKPHASDPHGYQAGGYVHITQLSTDGFPAYPEAVDLAFGPYAKYGQIIKDYRNATSPAATPRRKWSARSGRGYSGYGRMKSGRYALRTSNGTTSRSAP